jgi:hypothetical protein
MQRGIVDLHVYCGLDTTLDVRGMNDQQWEFSPKTLVNTELAAAAPRLLRERDELREALEEVVSGDGTTTEQLARFRALLARVKP